jgi:anti-anti-sigma regulatory factor
MTSKLEFALPERVSIAQENALLPFLRDNPDVPITISAARLRRMDAQLVQALLAVAADRRARGVPISLTELSRDHAAQFALLGVTDAMISFQVAQ